MEFTLSIISGVYAKKFPDQTVWHGHIKAGSNREEFGLFFKFEDCVRF
jgi:hypothetical protein